MLDRIKNYYDRYQEINNLISNPDSLGDSNQLKKLYIEHSKIEPIAHLYENLRKVTYNIRENRQLLETEKDKELRELAEEELDDLEQRKKGLEDKAVYLLLPKNPDDHRNVIMEIRAGTGGDEACLFVGDLVKMYRNYAQINKWSWEVMSISPNEIGGFKEYCVSIAGKNVFEKLKFEVGTHRVQRVPDTETQGRVHTSAATVAVLAEPDDIDVEIRPQDLKIDTYRAQGAGGQHVNTTDSAIRITHIPTGIVVTCQEERSQIKNRSKAMKHLQAKLYEDELDKQTSEEKELRKKMVGSGDRSEKVRTYNYHQDRITDHRIKMTLYKLQEIMETGDISTISEGLLQADLENRISELSNDQTSS